MFQGNSSSAPHLPPKSDILKFLRLDSPKKGSQKLSLAELPPTAFVSTMIPHSQNPNSGISLYFPQTYTLGSVPRLEKPFRKNPHTASIHFTSRLQHCYIQFLRSFPRASEGRKSPERQPAKLVLLSGLSLVLPFLQIAETLPS